MNNTNNALETLVQRDKQIKKTNDKLKASINELDAELETTTNAISTHVSNTDIHTSKEELIQLIIDHLESLDLGITKEVVSVLPTENISDNTLYFVPNDKGFHNEYLYINDKWELVGSTATNFTDYYTKQETDTLLESKANSVHSHVVSDITDFPTIPTKLSQLENDMGFGTGGDTSDCVHKTGNETINGIKTFTSDINFKNNNIDLTVTPTNTLYSNFIFRDKNEKTLSYIQYAHTTNGIHNLGLFIKDSANKLYGVSVNSAKEFLPYGDNTYSLGKNTMRWANAYIANTYTNRVTAYSIVHPNADNNSYFFVSGGSDYDKGATLYLGGISATNFTPGRFALAARKTDGSSVELAGSPNGTLTWGGKNVAIDENLVHKTGDEIINGTKIFSNTIHRYADLTTSGSEQVYRFDDTNANTCGHIYNNTHWTGDTIYNRHGAYNEKSGKTMEIDITTNDSGVGMIYAAGTATIGNLKTVTSATGHTGIATMGWVNNPATSTNVVHRSGNETIKGVKFFDSLVYLHNNMSNKNSQMDLFTTPANTLYAHYMFVDKNNEVSAYMQYGQQNFGTDFIGLFIHDKNRTLHGLQVTTNNEVIPISNNTYSLGSSTNKWKNVYATTFNGNLNGNANSATYATTQATSDNSTKIATTAWVRTYVNSVGGSGSMGSSISAYYSNATTLTAEGHSSSSSGPYPSDYSDYINIAPTVGTIYTGSQLFSTLNASASGSISSHVYQTTAKATATFSGAFSASAKYLCTTANAVKFRAYVSQGTSSAMGSPSVVDNLSAKSIFIRVQ